MAEPATQEEGGQSGSPMEFRERLSTRQVEELGKILQQHEGELCLCVLKHSYTVEERNPFYHGGRRTWGIMAPEQEFTIRRVVKTHLFVWKASGQRPEPKPDGLLVIPTERHLCSSSRSRSWRVLGVWEFERVEGPIQHELLKNEPFDLHPELPIPPSAATLPDPLSLLPILAGLRGLGDGRTSDHEVKIAFFFGDQPVYDRVFKNGLEEHAASHPTLAIQTVKDVEFLGFPPPNELLEMAANDLKRIRHRLLQEAVKCLQQGQPLDDVQKEYRQWVGDSLEELTVNQLCKLLAEAESDDINVP